MQKALPNSLQIFNKKRTLPRDRHFSQTYTQGRETRFLTYYLVAKPLIFLRKQVFWRGMGCMACRMPNPLFPSDFYPLYQCLLHRNDLAVIFCHLWKQVSPLIKEGCLRRTRQRWNIALIRKMRYDLTDLNRVKNIKSQNVMQSN